MIFTKQKFIELLQESIPEDAVVTMSREISQPKNSPHAIKED